MDHLFNSAVRVEEMQLTAGANGMPVMDWAQAHNDDAQLDEMLGYLRCRLDMNFVRPGKDIQPAPVAGRAPDRIGLLFTFPYAPIRAGQRIVAIENEFGDIPVKGTFEIRVIPDEAVDFSRGHHLEVQVIEVNQSLQGRWPFDADSEDTP